MTIGTQIRKRRAILGLTMQDVVGRLAANDVVLSKAAISKYENGKSTPKATVLHGLSRALECSTEYLLAEPTIEIAWLRFRRKTTLSKKLEVEVKEVAKEWLQARLLVDNAIGTRSIQYELPSVRINEVADAESVADQVRERWNVGDWPIESLSLAMEKSGVIVVEVDAEKELDGLSGVAQGQIRFVVVTTGVPIDRMRMNLAHELGHIVLKPGENEKFDEKAAFRFGASLLIPSPVIFDRIGRSRRNIDLGELLLLKEEFGISIQALIRRCFDLGVIGDWIYRQLNIGLRASGWHTNEPGNCSQLERPSQLQSHLLRCVTEGLVSEKEIRSMLPDVAKKMDALTSDSNWRWGNLRSMPRDKREEVLRNAAELAKGEYSDGGSLAGLELVDDEG